MSTYRHSYNNSDNELMHYGIKGQKWGVRRFQNLDRSYTEEGKIRYGRKSEGESSLSNAQNRGKATRGLTGGLRTGGVYDRNDGTKDMKRLEKDAKKDAEDMARAKAYYGEGAGNRRKQIRNRISERMKDPDYKASYEKHLAEQDMSKHQKAANRERKVQDTKDAAARVGRGLKNILLGAGTTSVTAIALYNLAKMTGADKKIAEFGKKAVSDIVSKAKSLKKPSVKDYNWHPDRQTKNANRANNVSNANYAPKRDFVEKNDRAKHGNRQPWIDDQGNIHFK